MAPPNSGNHHQPEENHRTSPESESFDIIVFILRLILQLFEAQQTNQEFQDRQIMVNTEILTQLAQRQGFDEQSSGVQPPSPTPSCDHCHQPDHLPKYCPARIGPCWECGERGHKKINCPMKQRIPPSQPTSFKKPGTSQSPTTHKRCFRCGDVGHIRKNCPNPFPVSGQVIAGTILIASIPARSMFDSGASFCYLSRRFVAAHSIPVFPLPKKLRIGTGIGITEVTEGYTLCPVVICGRELYADFKVMDMPCFDAVFGMDWLSTFYASIDCRQRKVVFRIPNHPKFELQSGQCSLESPFFRAKPTSEWQHPSSHDQSEKC